MNLMMRDVKVATWNVNGLRAVLRRLGQSLQQFLDSLGADLICLQETKMTRSELDQELVRPAGFDAFYSFCRHRGGYSGVVTFVRSDLPTAAAEEGLTGLWPTKDCVGHVGSLHNELPSKLVNELETEGRCIITDHQAFVLVNTYCPALASADRLEYKLQFHALLEDRVKTLRAANRHVIVVGDINVAHREIDHCDPDAYRSEGGSFGDHPCRRWMDAFVGEPGLKDHNSSLGRDDETKMVDVFRHFHPKQMKAFTCWNTQTGARQTNYGTRIDYVLVDPAFLECVSSCSIEPERVGSDHCPVIMSCTVELETDASTNAGITAALCAKNFIEFSGKQQSIKSFVVQNQSTNESVNANDHGYAKALPTSLESRNTGASKPKNLINRGQQSITSFFSHAGVKRKSTSRGEALPTQFRVFSRNGHVVAKTKTAEEEKLEWQQVLSGRPPPTPLCYCRQPTVLRLVVKAGENWRRKFYVCTKPAGEKGSLGARCNFFKWADNNTNKKAKS